MLWKRQPPPAAAATSRVAASAGVPGQISPPTPAAPCLGHGLLVRGELSGSADLRIAGRVEGRIELRGHEVLVAREGAVHARIVARSVVIEGSVVGDVIGLEQITLRAGGRVEGDLRAPRVALEEGALLLGRVDMSGDPEASESEAMPEPVTIARAPAAAVAAVNAVAAVAAVAAVTAVTAEASIAPPEPSDGSTADGAERRGDSLQSSLLADPIDRAILAAADALPLAPPTPPHEHQRRRRRRR